MVDWRKWKGMALDSQWAAQLLHANSLWRPCASRLYYAAYQAVTVVSLYRGIPPPEGREAWSHDATPDLIVEQWEPYLREKGKRINMKGRLERLYILRVSADYVGDDEIYATTVNDARRDSNFLIKTMQDILPGE